MGTGAPGTGGGRAIRRAARRSGSPPPRPARSCSGRGHGGWRPARGPPAPTGATGGQGRGPLLLRATAAAGPSRPEAPPTGRKPERERTDPSRPRRAARALPHAEGRVPLVVGGTGLYVRALEIGRAHV